MHTVLLTGMPRSGTSLVCTMLNEQPDTVALVEPMQIPAHGDIAKAVKDIDAFIAETRRQILETRRAPTKLVGGVIPENTVAEAPAAAGALRPLAEKNGTVTIDKPLSADFRLVIKHPALFSALAGVLAERHGLHAMVRDPLAVLASWQTVDMPVNRGHMPAAEAFRPELAARLAAMPEALDRQIALIEWLLTSYAALPPGRVLRYEDILADPTGKLEALSGRRHPPAYLRRAHAAHERYPTVDFPRLAIALRPIIPLARPFYPDFEASLAAWTRGPA
jgi:hypothetical protein